MKRTSKPTKITQTRAPTSLITIPTEAPYRDQVDPIKYPVALITRAPTSLTTILTEAPYRDQVDPIKYPVALINHAPSSSVIMETEAPYYDQDEINPVRFPLPANIP
jgi:transglutaminase-like putative cysteine protease